MSNDAVKTAQRSYRDHVAPDEQPQIHKVAARYSVKVTENILSAIKGNISTDPVAKQYIPQAAELKTLPGEDADPIGDDAHSPVKGIVHRYPDRVLFKVCGVCAVYCRYCFRREMIGPETGILSPREIDKALDYIKSDKNIWEVILTGGDPLVLSPRRLGDILQRLAAIDHVKILRIHTRVPLAAPDKVTDDLCKALKRDKPVYVVLHVNHAQEITAAGRAAIQELHDAGCVLLSQSVLLRGVNDNPAVLEDLFRRLVELRVKPYYLHHPDLAPGTGHFRLSIAEGQKIVKALRGHVSGLCQPTYMLDIPGGHGKVPVDACFTRALENGTYLVEDYKGQSHIYPPETPK